MGNVQDVLSMGNQVMVATGYGVLHRLSREGTFYSGMAIDVHQVPFANDPHPASRGNLCSIFRTSGHSYLLHTLQKFKNFILIQRL